MIKNMVLVLEYHSSTVIFLKTSICINLELICIIYLILLFYIGAAPLKENEFYFQRFVEIKILSFFPFPYSSSLRAPAEEIIKN